MPRVGAPNSCDAAMVALFVGYVLSTIVRASFLLFFRALPDGTPIKTCVLPICRIRSINPAIPPLCCLMIIQPFQSVQHFYAHQSSVYRKWSTRIRLHLRNSRHSSLNIRLIAYRQSWKLRPVELHQ